MHKAFSVLALVALAACGSDGSTDTGATAQDGTDVLPQGLTLGFRVGSNGAGLRAATGSTTAVTTVSTTPTTLTVSDGTNVLVFSSVELVVAELELERTEATEGCGSSTGTGTTTAPVDDDSCEKIDAGPLLVQIPVDGSVSSVVTAELDAGEYDEIEFEIDRPGDDTDADAAFVTANPDFEDISVRVRGTYNGAAFEYAARVQAEQEIELAEPLVIDPAGAYGLTLSVDIAGWFVDPSTGALIDPAMGLEGENEENIEDNIEESFEAFGDDDADGVPNSDDEDEHSGHGGGDDDGSDDDGSDDDGSDDDGSDEDTGTN